MSEVDRYLDEMFDRLAGTGSAGRRALAETEDHLRASAAAGMAEPRHSRSTTVHSART
jgi:hypothetical protein